MPKRTIGIDVGRTELRAVQLAWSGKTPRLEHACAVAVGDGDAPARWGDAFVKLKRRKELRFGAPTVLSAAAGSVMYQSLDTDLPDLDSVRRVLDFELEDEFPHPVGEAILDAAFAESLDDGLVRYLAAAAPRRMVESVVEGAKDAGLDAEEMTTDGMALAEIVRAQAAKDGERLAVLLAGERCLLALVREGRAVALRDASDAIGDAVGRERLGAVAREVEIMLRTSCRCGDAPRLALVDSGAQGRALAEGLGEALGREVELLDLAECVGSEECDSRWAVAVGLALRAGRSTEDMDFLKVEARRGEAAQSLRRGVAALGVLAVLVFGLWAALVAFDLNRMESQHRDLRRSIAAAFTEAMPGEPLVQPQAQLDERLRGLRAEHEGFRAMAREGLSPLDVLRFVTARVPQEMELRLDDMLIEGGRVRMRGQTDSFAAVENLKGLLERADEVAEAKIDEAQTGGRNGAVRFAITIQMRGGER